VISPSATKTSVRTAVGKVGWTIRRIHASPEISVPSVIERNAGHLWVRKLTTICNEITVSGPADSISSVLAFGST
jgi:hypothetical protein